MSEPCVHFQQASKTLSNDKYQQLRTVVAEARFCQTRGCAVTAGLHVCLTCCHVGCGRQAEQHALQHAADSDHHDVAMGLSDGRCWCYGCDDTVPVDLSALLPSSPDSPKKVPRRAESPPAAAFGAAHCGLTNLGNTCYMNAALQAFLIWGFFAECSAFIPEGARLAHALQATVAAIRNGGGGSVTPGQLVREIRSSNAMFQGYSQQDAMDLLRYVLDRTHEELKYVMPGSGDAPGSSPLKVRRSVRLHRDLVHPQLVPVRERQFRSVVSDTFLGRLRSEIFCFQCKNTSVKEDPFFDLSIPITMGQQRGGTSSPLNGIINSIGDSFGLRPVPLEACMQAFCEPETLDGKDRYRCEHCKALVACSKRLTIAEAPPVLCVQLKRFKHDSYFSSKLNTTVTFPLLGFDLAPYMHDPQSSAALYDLVALVNHRGSFSSGHYVAYGRHAPEKWIEFDDSCLRTVTADAVAKTQPYVLLYAQRRPPPPSEDLHIRIVSRQWYNRHLHLSTAGPVDSSDICCPHSRLRRGVREQHWVKTAVPQTTRPFAYVAAADECDACAREHAAIEERRSREASDLARLDSSSIPDGSCWYLVSTEWLSAWLDFRNGATDVPPGPISNQHLLDAASGAAKPDLHRQVHYRGVNEGVWRYLHHIYGGGPALPRRSINIYAPAATESVDVEG